MTDNKYRINASFPKDVYDWISEQAKIADISRSAYVKITMRQIKQQQEMVQVVQPMMDFFSGLSPDLLEQMLKGNKTLKLKDRKALQAGLKLVSQGLVPVDQDEKKEI